MGEISPPLLLLSLPSHLPLSSLLPNLPAPYFIPPCPLAYPLNPVGSLGERCGSGRSPAAKPFVHFYAEISTPVVKCQMSNVKKHL